jgi:hypothetical protein
MWGRRHLRTAVEAVIVLAAGLALGFSTVLRLALDRLHGSLYVALLELAISICVIAFAVRVVRRGLREFRRLRDTG